MAIFSSRYPENLSAPTLQGCTASKCDSSNLLAALMSCFSTSIEDRGAKPKCRAVAAASSNSGEISMCFLVRIVLLCDCSGHDADRREREEPRIGASAYFIFCDWSPDARIG